MPPKNPISPDDPLNAQRIALLKSLHLQEPYLPVNTYILARLDGRCLSQQLNHPLFSQVLQMTTRHLMQCGFKSLFAFTYSDEITLCIHPEESAFGRRAHKWLSILAGEASAKASLTFEELVSFDCRLAVSDNPLTTLHYLYWRQREALRQPAASGGEFLYWKSLQLTGWNPITDQVTQTQRRTLSCLALKPLQLPQKQAFYLQCLDDLTNNYTL